MERRSFRHLSDWDTASKPPEPREFHLIESTSAAALDCAIQWTLNYPRVRRLFVRRTHFLKVDEVVVAIEFTAVVTGDAVIFNRLARHVTSWILRVHRSVRATHTRVTSRALAQPNVTINHWGLGPESFEILLHGVVMLPLKGLDWRGIRELYDQRKAVYGHATTLFRKNKLAFAELVLGVSDPVANFSASRYGLGPKVLALNPNADDRVHKVAAQFVRLKSATLVPELIRNTGLHYFQISVGSEVSCIVNPMICWVANRRTIWAHLLVRHKGNTSKANEELELYRDDDRDSEMHYSIWSALHGELAMSMPILVKQGTEAARRAGVSAGTHTFLWGDAVANELYEQFHG